MVTKKDILSVCFDHVQKRIDQIKLAIDDANYSIREETKSSAGDKYETSREMIQQDLSRFEQQLNIALQDYQLLKRIDELVESPQVVSNGSMVVTSQGIYFIAISIGVLKCGDSSVFVVSLESPIGQALKGKKQGDHYSFRSDKEVEILSIL